MVLLHPPQKSTPDRVGRGLIRESTAKHLTENRTRRREFTNYPQLNLSGLTLAHVRLGTRNHKGVCLRAMSEARIQTRIWTDTEFCAMSAQAQRLYLLLLSQSSRNHAGILPLTVRRWANLSSDTTEDDIRAALNELVARNFIVVDWDTEEVLIRTYIRNDKVYRHRQVMTSALRAAGEVVSGLIRYALHDELLRLPSHETVDRTRETADALVLSLNENPGKPCQLTRDEPGGKGLFTKVTTVSPTPNPLPLPPTPAPVEPSQPQPSPNARGSRLPTDWQPNDEVIHRMHEECPLIDLRAEHRKFCDYWIAQPGQKGRKTDWAATWRNWMRRAAEQQPNGYTTESNLMKKINGWAALMDNEDNDGGMKCLPGTM